jgi:hypothetical protein
MKGGTTRKRQTERRTVKVTVSLPAELFAWGERVRGQRPRSQFVSALYRQQQLHQRVERARAAYAEQPLSEDEDAVLSAGLRSLDAFWSSE